MYASNLRRIGAAANPRGGAWRSRGPRPLYPTASSSQNGRRLYDNSSSSSSDAAALAEGKEVLWRRARERMKGWVRVPSASSVAGAVALVPVIGGAWLLTTYSLRQRLCEHHLQQVEGPASNDQRRRRTRNGVDVKTRSPTSPLCPGSSEDARGLRDMLELPARGVTVLCVDPPASYTGDAFLRSALLGRAATVHIRAGEGDGSLAACLARGLGVQFMTTKLQVSSLLPGLGERGLHGAIAAGGGLSDVGAVLETTTAALEEIRSQADDPRHHLPPVIIVDGLLGRIRAGESVPATVEAVLRWCWTISGGRRLAHVVLTAPQSMAVDGSLVRVKGFLNDGRPSPGMLQVVALTAPDTNITERRFRARFVPQPRTESGSQKAPAIKGDGGSAQGERMVMLCMELVHCEGCGVAEEANEVLRRAGSADSSSTQGKKPTPRHTLDGVLEGLALEAWRRAAAAVATVSALETLDPASAAAAASAAVERVPVRRRDEVKEQRRWSPPSLGYRDNGGGGGPEKAKRLGDVNPGFVVDDYASLEDFASADEGGVAGSGESGTPSQADGGVDVSDLLSGVPADATPLQRLMGLMEELADGGTVTIGQAVASLNGDGETLGRLLGLGVLRLCPQATPTGAAGGRSAAVAMLPMTTRLGQGARVLPAPGVLAEAEVAFEVGAATPIMAGVFAILRGCDGVEEQAIATAINVLRGGNPGGFLTELATREEWQAQREATMADLVQRAFSGNILGEGSDTTSTTLSSRRVQTAIAAVGCMATRKEIEDGMVAAQSKVDLTAAVLVPELLRACRVKLVMASNNDQSLGGEQTNNATLPASPAANNAGVAVSSKKLRDAHHHVDEVEDEKSDVGVDSSPDHEGHERASTSVRTAGELGEVNASSPDVFSSCNMGGNDRGGASDADKGGEGLVPGPVTVDRVADSVTVNEIGGESSSSTDEGATGSTDSPDGGSLPATDDRIGIGGGVITAVGADAMDATTAGAAVPHREAEIKDAERDTAGPESPEELVPASTSQIADEALVSTSRNTLTTHSDQSRASALSDEPDENESAGHVAPSTTENDTSLPEDSELLSPSEDGDSGGKSTEAHAGQVESDVAGCVDVGEAEVESSATAPPPRKNGGKLWGWSLPAWAGGGGGKSE